MSMCYMLGLIPEAFTYMISFTRPQGLRISTNDPTL